MTKSFNSHATPLAGLVLLERVIRGDSRGWLQRMFCTQDLAELGVADAIAQSNLTLTRNKGAVRGMHFQYPPAAEKKLVSCIQGSVFDVAIDLRAGSPTFLQWHAEILSADRNYTLLIPEGFAHGFQALTPDCQMLYFHTAAYAPECEGGLHPQDKRLAIDWPLAISEISARDAAHPALEADFRGIAL